MGARGKSTLAIEEDRGRAYAEHVKAEGGKPRTRLMV